MHLAARMVKNARKIMLAFGRGVGHTRIHLRGVASPVE
jgi:hypothetical protein